MSQISDTHVSKVVTGGGIILVGVVIHYGAKFATKLLIARAVSPAGYGTISVGLAFLTVSTIVVLAGTDTGVGRFLPRYQSAGARRGVLLSAFSVVVPVSVILALGAYLLSPAIANQLLDAPGLTPVLQILSVAIPFMAMIRLTVGCIRGLQKSVPRVLLQNLSLPILQVALIVVALLLGTGVTGLAWAYVVAYAAVSMLSLYYLFRKTSLFDSVEADFLHRDLLVFSIPLMVTATMNVVFGNVDSFIIAYFSGVDDVGVYNAAYPLAALLTAVINSLGFVFMPVLSQLQSDGDGRAMKRTYQLISKWVLLATLPLFLCLCFYSTPILSMTFGSAYASGGLAISVLAVGFFVHAVAGPSQEALVALGRSRAVMYDNVAVVVLNIALNIYLIPRYGILGAAVATTVGYTFMNSLYVMQLYQQSGVHPFRWRVVKPSLIAIVLWVGLYVVSVSLSVSPLGLVPFVVLYGVVYGGVVLRFGGVEQEEIDVVERIERKSGIDLDGVKQLLEQNIE